jgi:sugar lactone lactonase YvrE
MLAVSILSGCCIKLPEDLWRSQRPNFLTLEVVAEIPGRQITGLAVSETGRIFVCFPYWRDPHTISVAEVSQDGSLTPYPNTEWNAGPESAIDVKHRFVCVQSVFADERGFLWILDAGAPKMAGVVPDAPKLVQVDLFWNTVRRIVRFDDRSVFPDSYLNDVRIDYQNRAAYITDSGHGGLLVVDLDAGDSRRVLDGHPSTLADPNVALKADGVPLEISGQPLRVHADGIALDRKRGILYWQALTGRTLYLISTSALNRAALSEESLESVVYKVGLTCATDGMEVDSHGNIYFTDFQNNAIRAVCEQDRRHGEIEAVVVEQSPLLVWPDSLAWGPDGSLYISTSQIHRTDWFSPDGSMPSEPYRILRLNKNYPEDD